MPPGKPEQTPEQRALRLRAYELFLATDSDGKRRSLRSIAMTLGVTLGTVQYWQRVDGWNKRVDATLKAHTAAQGASTKALVSLLRVSLLEHVGTLNTIIRDDTTKPAVRLRAIGELADICHKLKIIDPRDIDTPTGSSSLDFKDDLGEPHGPPPTSTGTDVQRDELPAGADPHDHDHTGSRSGRSLGTAAGGRPEREPDPRSPGRGDGE